MAMFPGCGGKTISRFQSAAIDVASQQQTGQVRHRYLPAPAASRADSATAARYHAFAAVQKPGAGRRPLPHSQGGNIMPVEGLIVWLIVGAIAGWLAGLIVKGYGFGLIGNIVVGVVGAFIAGFLFPRLGISLGVGFIAAVIHAVIGAVILLVIIGLVRRV
jgi:uncharacterized membrane protein YeaQ/YmgE (transglycosylase-associated protein family)